MRNLRIDDLIIRGTQNTPALTVSPTSLTGFSYVQGNGPSASQSYNLSGSNLTPASGNITVTGSTNYEVSTDNSSFAGSVSVPYTSSTLSSTPIYVRLKAGLSAGNYNSETVSNAGGGATTQNVSCSGTVIAPAAITHTGTAPAAANLQQGSLANVLYRTQVTVATSAAVLTQVVATTAGTWVAADLTNMKLRYSTDATLDGADATLATVTSLSGGAGDVTFTGFSQSIPIGTVYLFVTCDVASNGTPGNTVSAGMDADGDFTYTVTPSFSGSSFATPNIMTIIGAPEIQLEYPVGTNLACGGTVAFGNVPVGTTSSATIRIRNSGTADLNLTNLPLSFSGTGAADYSFTTAPTTPITAGNYIDIVVQAAPSAAGSRPAALSFSNNDADENPCGLNFTLTGTAPEIQLKEMPAGTNRACGYVFSMGTVNVGSTSSLTVRIDNSAGQAPLNLTNLPLVVTGANASEFSITTQPSSPIAVGSFSDVVIQFAPTSDGAKTADISISNNDLNENPCSISLSGTGFQPLYFRTATSGDWNTASTWESSVDNNIWAAAARAPTSSDNAVTIQAHNLTLSTSVSIDELTISSSGSLEVTSGATLTVANGAGAIDLDVFGILKNTNSIITATGNISVENGGKYQHDYTSGSGAIPTISWLSGSTCEILGTNTGLGNLNQSYHHFIWNNQMHGAATLNVTGSLKTINGTFTLQNTGTGSLRLTGGTANTLNIGENLVIGAGTKLDLGNGGAASVVTVSGNVTMNTGSTLDLMGGSSSNGTVNIGGNLTMNGGTITESTSGTGCLLVFNGVSAQTATLATISNDVNLELNNAAGLTLLSSATSFRNLTLTSGHIRTNGNTLTYTGTITGADASKFICTCDASGATPSTSGGLKRSVAGNTTVAFPVGPTSTKYMPASLITAAGGHTSDQFTVRVENLGTGGVTTFDDSYCIQYQWIIDEATLGGSSAKVKVQWISGTEGANFNPNATPYIGHWNGASFNVISAATYAGADPSFTSADYFAAFSPFVAASYYGALPVELLHFQAKAEKGHTLLSFATASERDNAFFAIERSRDGKTYEEIGRVDGAGTSREPHQYSFTDMEPIAGLNYYRLRQTDFSGRFTYSPVVFVIFESEAGLRLYPSPVSDVLRVEIEQAFKVDARWFVFSLDGRMVNSGVLETGRTLLDLQVDQLPEGTYVLYVAGENKSLSRQFRKQ